MELLFIFWVVMAIVCAVIASSKGRSGFGFFVYGFLLWPIALIHALVMPSATRLETGPRADPDSVKCPHCAEQIKAEAKVCKHCGRDVVPTEPRPQSRACPSCGTMNATEKLICRNCRSNIEPWSPAAPPQETAHY